MTNTKNKLVSFIITIYPIVFVIAISFYLFNRFSGQSDLKSVLDDTLGDSDIESIELTDYRVSPSPPSRSLTDTDVEAFSLDIRNLSSDINLQEQSGVSVGYYGIRLQTSDTDVVYLRFTDSDIDVNNIFYYELSDQDYNTLVNLFVEYYY